MDYRSAWPRAGQGFILILLVLIGGAWLPDTSEVWRQTGFAEFSRGHFEDGGSGAYVSAAGRIQIINRLDLNQDGHLDLFIGNGHGHTENEDAYIYLNNGVEIDPLRRISLPADSAIGGLVNDFNKDGRSDLVVVNSTGGVTSKTHTYIYYGEGGSFPVESRRKLKAWTGKSAAAADWNGDGWLDLAIACANPNPLTNKSDLSVLYWNSPNGFDEARKIDLKGAGLSVLAADLNGDNRIDLALATSADTKIYWASATGLNFENPLVLSKSTSHLAAGDLNGDGYQELVVVGTGGIDILSGTNRGPAEKPGLQLVVMNPTKTVVSDLNGDKLPDIAVTSSHQMGNEHSNSFVFWNENGQFAAGRSTPLRTVNAHGISAGDLNSDGWPELVISNFGLNGLYANQDIQSFIYWNNEGSFSFARKSMLSTKGSQSNCIGDLNNDGKPDVVFFNWEGGPRDGYSPNYIYWGDGTRNYATARRTDLWSVYTTGIIQADFNDDGRVDLGSVEARYGGSSSALHGVYLWYGDPGGYSEDRRSILSVQDPEAGGRTADINRDGYLDLIIGAAEEGPDGKKGYVILYGGKFGFVPNRREVIPIGQFARPPLIADLNKDGHLDLIGGTFGTGLYLIYGSAQGFQNAKVSVTMTNKEVNHVEAADFDRDGWLDLVVPATVVGNKEVDAVVLYGSPQGFNDKRVDRIPNMDGYDPSIADYNRDGYLDIFIPNYAGNLHRSVPCYLYWGGTAGFDPKKRLELPCDSGAGSIPADFDGDGWIDIFVANHKREGSRDRPGAPIDHRTLSFLYWNGPEGFQPSRKTDIPAVGPHAQMTSDPGNIYTREYAEVYLSAAHRPTQETGRAATIQWTAETPLKTAVMFQVRGATTREDLERSKWQGPDGSRNWYTKPGKIAAGLAGPWFQYRARLTSPSGGASPLLTEVSVEFR